MIHDHHQFEAMNDFICFQRHKVKDYSWYHRGMDVNDCSTLTIEFYNRTDALLFKLAHG